MIIHPIACLYYCHPIVLVTTGQYHSEVQSFLLTLLSVVNVPSLVIPGFSFPVSINNMKHSSNIPKYTKTQACLTVLRFVSI